jgi:hypothetical protein
METQKMRGTPDGLFAPMALKLASYGNAIWDIEHLRYDRYVQLVENL